MNKICLFAGTTEGRRLAEYLCGQPVSVTVCVATEYGHTLLPEGANLKVSAGRLSSEEMAALLQREQFDLVLDATHPYAIQVTRSIHSACRKTDTEYIRILRSPSSQAAADCVFVKDAAEAVQFLSAAEGNILLTTGSKDLPVFCRLPNFARRVYARVLPMADSLQACREAGLSPSHILAMQGPFSAEMNLAMLHSFSIRWLVTKDGGSAGGLEEKAAAARQAGASMVILGRPPQEAGISLSQALQLLSSRFGCVSTPSVQIVGIGPGSRSSMTGAVCRALEEADCLIGAGRMLDAAAVPGQPVYETVIPEDIAAFIHSHREYQRFAVVMSGDTGFYSGTKKLLPLLHDCSTAVLPGISALSYLCSRLHTSWEDVFVVSLHGRSHDILPDIRAHSRVFALTAGKNGISDLCRTLTDAGFGHLSVAVGSRLSYPDEQIVCAEARELIHSLYDPLSVALICNPQPDSAVIHGLPDDCFLRCSTPHGVVPMTKQEVRSVCLSKLRPTSHSCCWDIGAGTGSVSVEMALLAKSGHVYAIERNEAALQLLEANRSRFSAHNLTIVSGTAPDVCKTLPSPSHVFIGGSSGNMRHILMLLLEKNPCVRIVATAVSLETAAELTVCMQELPFRSEVLSLQSAYDRKLGNHHMMTGRNPIYIFTLQAGGV